MSINKREHILIKLTVCGRVYPVRIKMKDEPDFRVAAQALNRKINQYKAVYQQPAVQLASRRKIDEQDCVLMAAIQACTETARLERETDAREMEERLRKMIQEADEYLSRV